MSGAESRHYCQDPLVLNIWCYQLLKMFTKKKHLEMNKNDKSSGNLNYK